MGILPRSATTTIRSSVAALLGGVGGLFDGTGPVHKATLALDSDADLPGGSALLVPGAEAAALVRLGPVEDHYSVCIKIPHAYGPGRDQDLLLASSADGIPFHHAVLPAENISSRVYSSLWLYLAGIEPVAFGLAADRVARPDQLTDGDRLRVLISSAVGRFRPIGDLAIGDLYDGGAPEFAGSNSGGGLRALPPALFYRG